MLRLARKPSKLEDHLLEDMHEEFQIMPGEPKTRLMTLTHGPCHCHGPHNVFAGLFEHLAEPLIELQGDQAMVVKL
jgi:hypothetical protein